jgi:hypothetical protein
MKSPSTKKILLYLVIAFIVFSIWTNPTGSASTTGHFLSHIGNFVSTLIDKIALFLKSLS